jgi:signal transduction histidine kinase
MNPPRTDPSVPLLLLGSFVIAVGSAWALLAMVAVEPPLLPLCTLAAAILSLYATGLLALRRSAAAGAELGMLRLQLEQTLARIEALTNSQGRFVGNIAHEIKTPLTIVLNHAELLFLSSSDPAAVRGQAKSIVEETRHLSDLVESFLRLARPFAQEDTSQHVPLYVHDFVVEAVRRCQSLARDSGVSVVPTLAESSNGDEALEVLGDAVLLEAMLENLVRNAVRFSPRGSRVELQVRIRGGSILLSVRDHGAGVAAGHIESVFDWFFQAPGETLQSSGTGFGLAIARRVADHHRGSISLRNHPEGGCEFEVVLPRWRGGELPAASRITTSSATSRP